MPLQAALDWAVARLAKSDQTEAQIRAGLVRRGSDEDEVEAVIQWLKERKLLNDSSVADRKAERLMESKSASRQSARDQLDKVGIPTPMQDQALEAWTDDVERAKARAFLSAKLKPGDSPAKLARLLASRGYQEELIRELLAEVFPDLDS